MLRAVAIAVALCTCSGAASAQQRPAAANTHKVVVVTRQCQGGVCVWHSEYRDADQLCGNRDETEAWRLLNARRLKLKLNALACDEIAIVVARAHSRDMCARGYFSHFSPEGVAPWARMKAGGLRFKASGENIGVAYPTAREVHQGWLASRTHRQNIERAGWTRAAVGVFRCSNGAKYWTQLFER